MRSLVLQMNNVCALILACLALSVVGMTSKPNILVMLIDDVSCDEFQYCGGNANTPNLNRLVRQGTSFRNAWSNPICQPTRAMLMTGDYAYVTKWWDNGAHAYAPAEFGTFAQKAKQNGYRTLIVGKWQLKGFARQHGFDEYCLWAHSDIESEESLVAKYNGTNLYDPTKKGGRKIDARYWEPLIVQNDVVVESDENTFSMFVHLNCIKEFVRRSEAQNKPFLIYYPETMVHKSYNNETRMTGFVPMPKLNSRGEIIGRERTASLGQMLQFMDYMIGRIVSFMEDEGVWKNTVAIFAGDNGTAGRGKGRTKGERGVWIPFIAVTFLIHTVSTQRLADVRTND